MPRVVSVNGAKHTELRHSYRCSQATLGLTVDENALSLTETVNSPACVDGDVLRTPALPRVCSMGAVLASPAPPNDDAIDPPAPKSPCPLIEPVCVLRVSEAACNRVPLLRAGGRVGVWENWRVFVCGFCRTDKGRVLGVDCSRLVRCYLPSRSPIGLLLSRVSNPRMSLLLPSVWGYRPRRSVFLEAQDDMVAGMRVSLCCVCLVFSINGTDLFSLSLQWLGIPIVTLWRRWVCILGLAHSWFPPSSSRFVLSTVVVCFMSFLCASSPLSSMGRRTRFVRREHGLGFLSYVLALGRFPSAAVVAPQWGGAPGGLLCPLPLGAP